jgi:hypothetical protein
MTDATTLADDDAANSRARLAHWLARARRMLTRLDRRMAPLRKADNEEELEALLHRHLNAVTFHLSLDTIEWPLVKKHADRIARIADAHVARDKATQLREQIQSKEKEWQQTLHS